MASAQIQLSSEQKWTALSVVNENTWWVGSNTGTIWITENNGESFSKSVPTGETTPLRVRQVHAIDQRRAFILSNDGEGDSRFYTTRNQGFSWQRLYRSTGDEALRCFAVIPDGEGWIFADTRYGDWHIIRSINGRNWIDSRNGFAGPVQPGEQLSNNSDQCARFVNDTWAAGTYHAPKARLIYKNRNELRFEVVDTPLTGGSGAGVHAVWPFSSNNILVAGGNEQTAELYRYSNGEFTAINTPPTEQAITILYGNNESIYVGNQEGLWVSHNEGEEWNVAATQGVQAFDCGYDNTCYALSLEGQVIRM
ncbi:hypothetical protein DQX04_05510 [Aliidiomarina sp. B3213]|nr:hypothetical protein DQX04_05510 [Aliidiomarina sp. B3213]